MTANTGDLHEDESDNETEEIDQRPTGNSSCEEFSVRFFAFIFFMFVWQFVPADNYFIQLLYGMFLLAVSMALKAAYKKDEKPEEQGEVFIPDLDDNDIEKLGVRASLRRMSRRVSGANTGNAYKVAPDPSHEVSVILVKTVKIQVQCPIDAVVGSTISVEGPTGAYVTVEIPENHGGHFSVLVPDGKIPPPVAQKQQDYSS